MRDLYNNLRVVQLIEPSADTGEAAITSTIVDLQGFDGVLLVVTFGELADAAFTGAITVTESDTAYFSSPNSVAAADLVAGTNPVTFNQASDNYTYKIGYIGNKQFIRIEVATTANAGVFPVAAVAILGYPSILPQSTQVEA